MRDRVCRCDNTGKGGVPYQPGWCYGCWLVHNRPEYGALHGIVVAQAAPMPVLCEQRPEPQLRVVRIEVPRKVKCVNLGKPLAFGGCRGRTPHSCDKGLPAVPAGYCQTCERYEGDFNEDGTGPGWTL